jgi:hypothetical protein
MPSKTLPFVGRVRRQSRRTRLTKENFGEAGCPLGASPNPTTA